MALMIDATQLKQDLQATDQAWQVVIQADELWLELQAKLFAIPVDPADVQACEAQKLVVANAKANHAYLMASNLAVLRNAIIAAEVRDANRLTVEGQADFLIQPNEFKPYDLSQFKPFETIAFGLPPAVRVTAESLAPISLMEGIESPSPSALEYMASFGAQTSGKEMAVEIQELRDVIPHAGKVGALQTNISIELLAVLLKAYDTAPGRSNAQ